MFAIALGVAPLPLLGVYAVLFTARGTLYPVNPPDIGGSQRGELVAGLAAIVLFGLLTLTLAWFLSRRRRWPFLLGQAATFGTAVALVADPTSGPPAVPALLIVTAGAAVLLGLLPAAAAHVRRPRRAGSVISA